MRALGPAGENILPRTKKSQAVLAFLCLSQEARLLRRQIAGKIWDRSGEVQARDSLRHALNELERTGGWAIETDNNTVRLDLTDCWIDALETPDRSDLLLEDMFGISVSFDRWLIGERARFEIRWQTRLEAQLKNRIDADAPPADRAAAARELLNFVPTHEGAVRALMTAYVEADERPLAIREYERFRQVIDADIGIPPTETTVALYAAIRSGALTKPSRTRGLSVEPTKIPKGKLTARKPDGPRVQRPAAAPLKPKQPSIAVLPFRALSGHDQIAEGLAEDLAEVLSRVPGLFVGSRQSTAMFRNSDRSTTEIGEALGVGYLVSASLRLIDDHMRLIVELADVSSGRALWVLPFNEDCSNLLEVQARIAETIVRRIGPHVHFAELNRVRIKRADSYSAYDLLLRAQDAMHNPSRMRFESAEKLFDAAIEQEPDYATALAWRAYWHVMRVGQGWSPDLAADARQADAFAERAAACDRLEPMAFAVRGHAAAFLKKDFDLAFTCFETALQINPNCARAWLWNANALAWTGEGRTAVAKVNRAMDLSPYDPLVCAYSGGASMAYLADGQYARAIDFALRCISDNRGYSAAYRLLISALVLGGREEEARGPAHQLLLLEPHFTVEEFRRRFPGTGKPLSELYCDAFSRAGIPLAG
jgi:TolB-like protein/DNA-binding SARP family transcriptional activator/Tfp pilus assembly protein PilF